MKITFIISLILIAPLTYSQTGKDSLAIVELLEKASISFRAGDSTTYMVCWHVQPYSFILISTVDGKSIDIPAQALGKPSSAMGQGGFATASNYRMSIHDDNGWTSFDEISTAKNGTKSYSHEVWMVEKINGDWKLVAASLHFYRP